MVEAISDQIRALLQECGYTLKSLDPQGHSFWAQRKKALKVGVVEKWTHADLNQAIDLLLLEEGEAEEAYKVVVAPGNEVGSGSLQPIEVIAKRYRFCAEHDINIWGMDSASGDLFLVTGSLPRFDFKLMSRLMQSKSMLGSGAQKVIENRVRNFLVRGFHTWEEFEGFSQVKPEPPTDVESTS